MARLHRRMFVAAALVVCTQAALSAQTDFRRPSFTIPAGSDPQGPTDVSQPTPLFNASQVVQQPAGPPPTPRHTGIHAMLRALVSDVKHLPSRENLMWVGIGSGLALAAHPFDDNLNRALVGDKT